MLCVDYNRHGTISLAALRVMSCCSLDMPSRLGWCQGDGAAALCCAEVLRYVPGIQRGLYYCLWSQKAVGQQGGPSCLLTLTSVSLRDAPKHTEVVLLALPFFLPLIKCPCLLGWGSLPMFEILEDVTAQVTKPLTFCFSGQSMDPVPALSC